MKKSIKEGAINYKKRLKYCSVTGEWIPFSRWKAHKAKLDSEVNQCFSPAPLTPMEIALQKTQAQLKELQSREYRVSSEAAQLRKVLCQIGHLLSVTYEY